MVATLVLEASAEMRESSSLSSRTNHKEIVLRNLKGKRIKEFGSTVVVEDGKFEKAMRQFKFKEKILLRLLKKQPAKEPDLIVLN